MYLQKKSKLLKKLYEVSNMKADELKDSNVQFNKEQELDDDNKNNKSLNIKRVMG